MRRSSDRYLFGESIDSATAGCIRLPPRFLASITDADLDATLPVYCIEGLGPAPGASVAHVSTTSGTALATFISLSVTVAAGNDRILVVTISTNVAAASAFFGSFPLTKLGAKSGSGGFGRAEIWYLVNPPVTTDTLAVYFDANGTHAVGASTYTGVDQRNPWGPVATATGTSTAPSVTATTATGQLVVDALGADTTVVATVGALQTQRWNDALTVVRGAGSTQAGADGGVMSWTLATSQIWGMVAAALLPKATLPVFYVLNGRYGYKINGSSYALMGTQDYGAGAQCGRPELFEDAHYIPLGSTVDAQKLTAFGSGDETTDTSAAITGIKAHAFAGIQDAGTAKLARALNNKVDISSDGADWSASPFEAGDSTHVITDLAAAPGEIVVIRPDGPRRFTASGSSLEIQGFSARNPAADATLGSNSHGHGPYTYWPDAAGLARILGESIDWIGPEADPDFGGAAIDAQPFPFTAGQWRSVTAINRWLYATHYSSLGSIDGDLFYGYIGGDGRVERWHGSLYDSDKPLRVTRLSTPALVIVEGKPGDVDTPAIRIMELDADGSPRTLLGGQRGASPASDETSEHVAIMPRLDWSWEGLGDREKQLARISYRIRGMVTGSLWSMRVWRDAAAQQTIGADATADGTFEVEPGTIGTSDTFYGLFVAPYLVLSDTYTTLGDPRLEALTVEARTAMRVTAEITVTRKEPAANLGFEEALSNLRKLQAGSRVTLVAPERANALNGHVIGVAEEMIGDADTDGWGYRLTITADVFDIDAGSS